MHFYQHHIGDFQRDTASLSDSDTMAYLRLIWMYYDTELPLPDDAKKLAFKIGSNPDSVQIILDTFFIKDGEYYRHARCDEELSKIYKSSAKARLAAQIRWAKRNEEKKNAMLNECESNADALINDANALEIDATHEPINPLTNTNTVSIKNISKKQDSKFKVSVDKPDDISEDLWIEFIDHRKSRRAPITPRVIDAFKREAKNAGFSLSKAIEKCIERNWTSFEAAWILNKSPQSKPVEALRGWK